MEITQICPKCSNVGIGVDRVTVESMVVEESRGDVLSEKQYYLCSSSLCELAYFSDANNFAARDIKASIWYKDRGLDVPICYCSNLSRADIIDAVKGGCRTIDEVQEFTGKSITGHCRTMNPTGKCCRNVFLYTIREARLE